MLHIMECHSRWLCTPVLSFPQQMVEARKQIKVCYTEISQKTLPDLSVCLNSDQMSTHTLYKKKMIGDIPD